MYDSYVHTELVCTVRRLFQERFPCVQVSSRNSIQRYVNKFHETGRFLMKSVDSHVQFSQKKHWTWLWKISLENHFDFFLSKWEFPMALFKRLQIY